ncbi:MAG: DUF975 family protein [Firmicutes bacterium]|nr:DUF975 family protein [Bacillota bacterium]
MQQNYVRPGSQPIQLFTMQQIKKIARMRLSGKWKKAIIPTIVYVILCLVPDSIINIITYDEFHIVGDTASLILAMIMFIYNLLLTGAFSVSIAALSLRIIRNEDFDTGIILFGFKKYGQSVVAYGLIFIFSTIWMMLFMIPAGVIMGLGMMSRSSVAILFSSAIFAILLFAAIIFLMRYQMTYFIVSDYGQVQAPLAIAESVRLMKNNAVPFVGLQLSFIGWALLTALPIAAASLLLFKAYTSGTTILYLPAFIAAAAGIVALSLLLVYVNTADAIFFSGISGNFRAANPVSRTDSDNNKEAASNKNE